MKRQLKIKEEESKRKTKSIVRIYKQTNKQTDKINVFFCVKEGVSRFVCVSDGCDSFPAADIRSTFAQIKQKREKGVWHKKLMCHLQLKKKKS